jgi:peptidoglycan/LPS O-acetylase OafA/YrhL
MQSPKAKAILGIDILRFLSALYVMLFHLGFWVSVPYTTGDRVTGGFFYFPWATGILSPGRMGVQTFFVISGFVIAYTVQNVTVGSFLRSRILRLVPAVWICGTITFGIALALHDRTPETLCYAWLRSMLFMPIGEKIDGTYWTLPIECSFYFLVLILIALRAIKWLEHVFLVVALASLTFCILIFFIRPEWNELSLNPWFRISLLIHGGEFAVGIFLWAILFKGVSSLRVAGLVAGLSAGAVEVINWMPRPEDRLTGLSIWVMSIVLIIAAVDYNARIHAYLSPHGRAVVRQLGLMTYPLYLLHQLVGTALMAKLAHYGVPQIICLGVTILAVIGAALIITRYGEPTLRQWLMLPVLDGLKGVQKGRA